MYGPWNMEKKTGKENINPNVVTEATHMPESGLVSWGKVSTFGQILLFWTPPVGPNFVATERCSRMLYFNLHLQHCKRVHSDFLRV